MFFLTSIVSTIKKMIWDEWKLEATLNCHYICTQFNPQINLYETLVFGSNKDVGAWYDLKHRYIAIDKERAIRWHYKVIEIIARKEQKQN